jgi:hypothetical protein
VYWSGYDTTSLDIEVDPQRRRFGSRKSDFALQALVECRALELKRFRLIALRWHSSGSEVRFGLRCVCLLLQDLVQRCLHGEKTR